MKFIVFVALFAVAYAATKDDLVKDADRLKGLAQTEITKLKSEGKTLLAHEIEVIEKEIIKVEKQVESLHPNTEVGKIGVHALDTVLKGLESKLEAELKKLSGAFYDNTKDTLIADASRLRSLAQAEITKLKGEGKHLLAAELQVLDNSLIAVEKQVEGLHPTTEVGKTALQAAETVLKGLESKLQAELKKLSGAFYDNTKDTLIADASRLKGLAQTEITKLKSEGKHLLAAELQVLENSLISIEKQVEALHPSTEVGKVGLAALEHVLKGVETKLDAELKKLSGSFFESTKEELTADATKLKKLANDEIKKLEAEGKTTLANGLKVLEKDIVTVEKHLESLHPTTEVGKVGLHAVETVLKGLESKLEAELKKLSGAFYDNTKDTLIADASRLRSLAQAEITKLKGEGKHLLAAELQVLDNSLIAVEKQVEGLHPTTEVGKTALQAAETVLKGLESKLQAELKKLSGAFYDNTKDTLIADASRLKGLAQTEITKLKSEGKTLLAHEVEILEKEIIKVEKQVESLHPNTEVGKIGVHALDTVLKGLESKLEAELKKLSGAFYDNTKDTLIADASRLRSLAQAEITKLKGEGKHLLAAELQVLDNSLIAVEKQVEGLHPTTEVGKTALQAAETVLKGLESKLQAELKKLSGN